MNYLAYEKFKIAAVSENTNSFGLYQMILVAKSGETWKACANSVNVLKKSETVSVGIRHNFIPDWTSKGYEIPEKILDCPPNVVKEIWINS